MADAGYSGAPLPKKLGLKDGQVIGFYDLPEQLEDLKHAAAFVACDEVNEAKIKSSDQIFDAIHFFTKSRQTLDEMARPLMGAIKRDGMVWISWPKKAAKVETDMSEDVIRELLLPIGLVDIKVCAVDAVWSGLKMVIRKELR